MPKEAVKEFYSLKSRHSTCFLEGSPERSEKDREELRDGHLDFLHNDLASDALRSVFPPVWLMFEFRQTREVN